MLSKRVHIVLLALLAIMNCALATEDANSFGYIDFHLEVREKTSRIDRVVERRITISDPSKSWSTPVEMLLPSGITHTQRERVFGVKGQYTSTDFNNTDTITKEALNELWSNLQNAGVLELKEKDVRDVETGWLGDIRIGVNDQTFHFRYKGKPKPEDTWYKVYEVLFDLLKQRGLDVPGEPREVSLYVKRPILSGLSFLSETPVPFPEQYINKKIETASETDGIIVIGFNEADNVEPLKGKLLLANEGITGLPGRSITWLHTNPMSITYEGDDAEPREVTLADIFKEPLAYHGKRVRVVGHLTAEFFENMNFVDVPSDGFTPGDHRVWVARASTFCEEGTRRRTGVVTIDGTFIFGPGGHYGTWPGVIDLPTRIVPTKEDN